MSRGSLAVVQDWLDAANHDVRERVLELSSRNVEIGGPRGTAHGTGAELSRTRVTSRFVVHGGVVSCYQRHEDLNGALTQAGFIEDARVAAPRASRAS
jgi:hypothetical protein